MVGKSEQILRACDGRVSFGELFYDLVFVFAITQISHSLLKHFTLTGARQTGFLFPAVWWVWFYSTWVLNRLNLENLTVRLLLFAMMIGGLFMSMALSEALGDMGAVFGITFAVVQVGRTVFVSAHSGNPPNVKRTYKRITSWVAKAGPFRVWGGLADRADPVLLWGGLGDRISGPDPALSGSGPGPRHDHRLVDQWRPHGRTVRTFRHHMSGRDVVGFGRHLCRNGL